jgi:hypothetical protein
MSSVHARNMMDGMRCEIEIGETPGEFLMDRDVFLLSNAKPVDLLVVRWKNL